MGSEEKETILDLLEQHVSDTSGVEDDPIGILKKYLHILDDVYVEDVEVEKMSSVAGVDEVNLNVTFSGISERR